MAAKKRALKERGRTTRARSNTAERSDRWPTSVRGETRALMRADAVLRCIAVALDYDDWSSNQPDYAEAIEVARNLISQSSERLESRKALRRDAELDAHPERAISLEELDTFMRTSHK